MAKLSAAEIERKIEEFMREARYDVYLQSKKWWQKRRACLIAHDFTCAECGYPRETDVIEIPLDVHHKTYERFGNEDPDDLVVLCRNCHDKVHGGKRRR